MCYPFMNRFIFHFTFDLNMYVQVPTAINREILDDHYKDYLNGIYKLITYFEMFMLMCQGS